MNKQEAWECLESYAEIARMNANPTMSIHNLTTRKIIDVADALKPPEPDPITGLVPSGSRRKHNYD